MKGYKRTKKGRCSESKLSAFLILSAISNFRMAYLLLKFASCLVPFLQNLCEELMWVYSLYIAKKFVVLLYTSFYSKQICNNTLNWVAKSIKHSSGGGKNGEKNILISGLYVGNNWKTPFQIKDSHFQHFQWDFRKWRFELSHPVNDFF